MRNTVIMRTRVMLALTSFAGALVAIAALPQARALAADDVVVFAAASLKTALDDVSVAWKKQTGGVVKVSLAGSSQLAKQIQQGAPADVFISANVEWMDVLASEKLVDTASRRILLRNRLVLVAHGATDRQVEIVEGMDLAGLLGDGRLAMAMVDSVPAGIYGKAALTSLGLWDKIAPKVAQADNVRAALALVSRGEAPYGIVYATDAAASDNVTVVATFPEATHPPIVYPAALVADSVRKDAARRFLDFLSSTKARTMFERQGFKVIEPAVAN